MPSRLETLKDFVAQAPDNAFARYGLAMELKQLGAERTGDAHAAAEMRGLLDDAAR